MEKQRATDYKRAFNEKAYDRLAITIPKGQKATIQAAAEAEEESINSFTNKALLARLGLEKWPDVPGGEIMEHAEDTNEG